MKVDISPNLPPISSWTTAAPAGSGVEGGGSSIWSRSMRRIMGVPPGKNASDLWPSQPHAPRKPAGGLDFGPARLRGEVLLVHHPAEGRRHSGALVEAERAGVVRRVDAEPDAPLAALPEAPERVAEQRRAHAELAPPAAGEEHLHPAAPVGVGGADRPRGDLVAGPDDGPERGVEALAAEVALRPRLEVARRVVPVIGERLLVRGVERARLAVGVE